MLLDVSTKIIQSCIDHLTNLFGSSVRLISAKSVGGGCINHSSRITTTHGDFFLKWNTQVPPDVFVCEAEGLNAMRQADPFFLYIPQVIWAKSADELPGMLLLEYLLPATDSLGYEERLGRGIARLHRRTDSAYGFYHHNYCGTTLQDNTRITNWAEFFAIHRIAALVEQISLKRGMCSSDRMVYEKLIDRIPQLLSHATIPSLIHGDLWSGNFMFTQNGPALIDPACYYADREMELGMMKLFGGFSPKVWKSYHEEFPLQQEWNDRIGLYQLFHLLNHQLLFGGLYGIQAIEMAKKYI
jgi:fructosamine-3-kinase